MKRKHLTRRFQAVLPILAAALALLCTSCSKHSKAARLLSRANEDFLSGNYIQAEIEYKNVLELEPLNPKSVGRLGIIYSADGSMSKAVTFLEKAKQLEPDDAELRLSAGQMELGRGNMKDARADALLVISKDPKLAEAPLLLAQSSVGDAEVADARSVLSKLALEPTAAAGALCGIGFLDFRRNQLASAEAEFRKALAADPNSSIANFGLGSIYLLRNDTKEADKSLEAAANLAPPRSQMRLRYADFKFKQGDEDGGRKALEGDIQKAPDFTPAIVQLAELDLRQKRLDEGAALITRAIQRDPSNPDAVMVGASFKLARGEPTKAATDLERLRVYYPRYVPTYYLLAQAYLSSGGADKAISSLKQALSLNPNFAEAALLLATVYERQGDFKAAVDALAQILEKNPNMVQALLLKAAALRSQGNLAGAADIYRQLEAQRPKDSEMPLFAGLVLLQLGQRSDARAAFARSLAISPDYLPATEQLINIDLVEKKYPDALGLSTGAVSKDPKSALARLILAKVYFAQKDSASAEAALLKAIELQPESSAAYLLLARFYVSTNRKDKAVSDVKQILVKNPKDTGALMLLATIYDEQDDYADARDTYEKILSINPNFTPALNNLAYVYSERFGQNDKAYDLAQHARELLPHEPHVADTLGWILFKRHEYLRAAGFLQESAARLPTDGDAQYHLGMAHYMMGKEDLARDDFDRSIKNGGDFADLGDAKKRLGYLSAPTDGSDAANRDALEQALAKAPGDPVILVHLAAIYEKEGASDKAEASYKGALDANLSNTAARLGLIKLAEARGDVAQAFVAAKEARNLEPDNADVTRVLGQLAFKVGDFPWAYSLLQELALNQPNVAGLQFDLGNAAFSVGKISDAETAMQNALQLGLPAQQQAEAKRFLTFAMLAGNTSTASDDAKLISDAVAASPSYVPALYDQGEFYEQGHAVQDAMDTFGKVLKIYPQFAPAKRDLAVLGATNPSNDNTTFDLATSALDAYPGDPALVRVLGIIKYRRKDYGAAVNFLQKTNAGQAGDPEALYILGKSHIELGNRTSGMEELKHALSIGLSGDEAADARRVVAGGAK